MEKLWQVDKDNLNLTKRQLKYYEHSDDEVWINKKYVVHVRRNLPVEFVKNEKGEPHLMTHLSIRRQDNMAICDWRDFQLLKNQLVGDENEGCEIYPAESRLVDGANQFHLWVWQDLRMGFPFGFFDGRMVSEKSFFGETQRRWNTDERPKDLEESEKKIQAYRDDLDKKANLIIDQVNKDLNLKIVK